MDAAAAAAAKAARLAALRGLGVMATPLEALLDRPAQAAAAACEAPTAMTSRRDDRRQIKAGVGLGGVAPIPRGAALCPVRLEARDDVEVGDRRAAPRRAGKGLVTGSPWLLFHAGAPLRPPAGHVVGRWGRTPASASRRPCSRSCSRASCRATAPPGASSAGGGS